MRAPACRVACPPPLARCLAPTRSWGSPKHTRARARPQGIRVCSVTAAHDAVTAGRAAPGEFKFFSQYSGWGPGQLQRECKAGVW